MTLSYCMGSYISTHLAICAVLNTWQYANCKCFVAFCSRACHSQWRNWYIKQQLQRKHDYICMISHRVIVGIYKYLRPHVAHAAHFFSHHSPHAPWCHRHVCPNTLHSFSIIFKHTHQCVQSKTLKDQCHAWECGARLLAVRLSCNSHYPNTNRNRNLPKL